MASNLDRFRADLDALELKGHQLDFSMRRETFGEKQFDAQIKKELGDKTEDFIKKLPVFQTTYQAWYSEALALLTQLLPERVDDFRRLYEKPKNRKQITFENYHIEDYLQGLRVTRGGTEVVVDSKAALPRFAQQMAILSAAKKRFESSLFEIRQLVQEDFFDSEVETARELLKNKFVRAAGAVAGVILEKHLLQVCTDHKVPVSKKHPTIGDFNDLLKNANVIDTAQWRYIQHLADIRNLCDHNKKAEPKEEQVLDLIDGVAKIMKTVL
jgi:hypothetical protein